MTKQDDSIKQILIDSSLEEHDLPLYMVGTSQIDCPILSVRITKALNAAYRAGWHASLDNLATETVMTPEEQHESELKSLIECILFDEGHLERDELHARIGYDFFYDDDPDVTLEFVEAHLKKAVEPGGYLTEVTLANGKVYICQADDESSTKHILGLVG